MTVNVSSWDVSNYLTTSEEIIGYLAEVAESGDPALLQAALGDVSKAVGMTKIAQQSGLGRESLYKALTSSSSPSFKTVSRVINALGGQITVVSAPTSPESSQRSESLL